MRRSRTGLEALRGALLIVPLSAVAPAAPAAGPEEGLAACAEISDPGERLACYDVLAGQPRDAPPVAAEDRFGAEALPGNAGEEEKPELETLTSRLVGGFDGWERNTLFRLENGQVWKSVGDNSGYYPGIPDNPAVTIERGFFGSYWMEVEGVGRKIKVRRAK